MLTVGNYALYENPYTNFTNLMQSVFTTDFIRRLGPLYTEKFIDLDGHLATSCDSVLACPMHDDLSRTVMDNCPDTYRLESVTDDTVVFALISHYDRNWATDTPHRCGDHISAALPFAPLLPPRMVSLITITYETTVFTPKKHILLTFYISNYV